MPVPLSVCLRLIKYYTWALSLDAGSKCNAKLNVIMMISRFQLPDIL